MTSACCDDTQVLPQMDSGHLLGWPFTGKGEHSPTSGMVSRGSTLILAPRHLSGSHVKPSPSSGRAEQGGNGTGAEVHHLDLLLEESLVVLAAILKPLLFSCQGYISHRLIPWEWWLRNAGILPSTSCEARGVSTGKLAYWPTFKLD